MCRLFGLRANRAVDVEFSLTAGPKTMRQLGEKHCDGWGVGWYENGLPVVKKEPTSAASAAGFPPTFESHVVVTHVRKATVGQHTTENCHPFQHERWLFAHNGTVERHSLLPKLSAAHRNALRGGTDSEVFFHWILQNAERESSVDRGLRTAAKDLTGFTGLNFVLTGGDNLYAYRNASKNEDYYSLFYLRRQPGPADLEELRSAEVHTLLRSKALRGESAVLICSERLTDEDWKEVPLGNLLVVGDDLSPRLVEEG